MGNILSLGCILIPPFILCKQFFSWSIPNTEQAKDISGFFVFLAGKKLEIKSTIDKLESLNIFSGIDATHQIKEWKNSNMNKTSKLMNITAIVARTLIKFILAQILILAGFILGK